MSLCADDGIGAKVWIFGFDRISEKVAWFSAKTEWGKEPSSCSAVTRWWVFSLRVTSAFRIKVPIFFLCWDNTGLVLWVWSLRFFLFPLVSSLCHMMHFNWLFVARSQQSFLLCAPTSLPAFHHYWWCFCLNLPTPSKCHPEFHLEP